MGRLVLSLALQWVLGLGGPWSTGAAAPRWDWGHPGQTLLPSHWDTGEQLGSPELGVGALGVLGVPMGLRVQQCCLWGCGCRGPRTWTR